MSASTRAQAPSLDGRTGSSAESTRRVSQIDMVTRVRDPNETSEQPASGDAIRMRASIAVAYLKLGTEIREARKSQLRLPNLSLPLSSLHQKAVAGPI
jgi:hypothetical protein